MDDAEDGDRREKSERKRFELDSVVARCEAVLEDARQGAEPEAP